MTANSTEETAGMAAGWLYKPYVPDGRKPLDQCLHCTTVVPLTEDGFELIKQGYRPVCGPCWDRIWKEQQQWTRT